MCSIGMCGAVDSKVKIKLACVVVCWGFPLNAPVCAVHSLRIYAEEKRGHMSPPDKHVFMAVPTKKKEVAAFDGRELVSHSF